MSEERVSAIARVSCDGTSLPRLAHCEQDLAVRTILIVQRLDGVEEALRGIFRVIVCGTKRLRRSAEAWFRGAGRRLYQCCGQRKSAAASQRQGEEEPGAPEIVDGAQIVGHPVHVVLKRACDVWRKL